MPTTVQSNDQRINRAHHGVPLISHGGENLILKEIQRGIRTKISSADYYYYILILHNTILWRLIFLLTTKRTKNRTNSNERGRSFWRRQKEPKTVSIRYEGGRSFWRRQKEPKNVVKCVQINKIWKKGEYSFIHSFNTCTIFWNPLTCVHVHTYVCGCVQYLKWLLFIYTLPTCYDLHVYIYK